ncbi:MAG: hypothetical protein ACXVRH_01170 [Thermoleophilaceae bacterium]
MAEDLTPPEEQPPGHELAHVGRELEPAPKREIQQYVPYETKHVHKFRMAFAGLVGFGVAAVAAAVLFLIAGRPPKPPAWSEWKPSASGDAALEQIATHVGQRYRLPSGQQLVLVEGGPLQIGGFPVHVVLQPTATATPSLSNGQGALYVLSGMGPKGSITTGKPSQERMLLLRREALELALYTFRYEKDVKQVVAILPPAPKTDPVRAMFFRRGDVSDELARPLRFTLPGTPPPIESLHTGPMHDYLNKLTNPGFYFFGVQQAQDANFLLILSHSPPQPASSSSSSGP